jgi:hypothetical protein
VSVYWLAVERLLGLSDVEDRSELLEDSEVLKLEDELNVLVV